MLNKSMFVRARNALEGDGQSSAQASIPEKLCRACPACKAALFSQDLQENLLVCPQCGHYFRMDVESRLRLLVDEGSCDLAVSESVADFLLQSWTSAGRASLRVTEIDAESLHIPQARVRELRDTVMRLRLDAVAATGFGLSRTKAAELIASGRVQVNHRECTKGDQMLNQGDVVTARGFGKFELSQVGGQSRKGRTAIVVKRYL